MHDDTLKAGGPAFGFNYGGHARQPRTVQVQNVGPRDRPPRVTDSSLEGTDRLKLQYGHALRHNAEYVFNEIEVGAARWERRIARKGLRGHPIVNNIRGVD